MVVLRVEKCLAVAHRRVGCIVLLKEYAATCEASDEAKRHGSTNIVTIGMKFRCMALALAYCCGGGGGVLVTTTKNQLSEVERTWRRRSGDNVSHFQSNMCSKCPFVSPLLYLSSKQVVNTPDNASTAIPIPVTPPSH